MAKERDQIPEHLKWRVEDIFETQADFEKTYEEVDALSDLSEFEGKLSDKESFLACMTKLNRAMLGLMRLDVYAFMLHDQDTRNADYTALTSRVDNLGMKLSGAAAFINPELSALPEKTLREMMADPALSDYDYTLR